MATADNEPVLTCGDLAVDLNTRQATLKGRELNLTPNEYEILKTLTKHAGRVLTHKQILQAVWGNEPGVETHYIRVYIRLYKIGQGLRGFWVATDKIFWQ